MGALVDTRFVKSQLRRCLWFQKARIETERPALDFQVADGAANGTSWAFFAPASRGPPNLPVRPEKEFSQSLEAIADVLYLGAAGGLPELRLMVFPNLGDLDGLTMREQKARYEAFSVPGLRVQGLQAFAFRVRCVQPVFDTDSTAFRCCRVHLY
ncbi:unnamed protein product [Symbiodinium sp. CCMP2456]|nr:unnamed protein product [Symbiodinium sp. CCMP2456]